jgi:uncharacterized integral membrane protein
MFMGKLTYLMLLSVDGYIEDVDGKFGWAEPTAEVHAFVNDLGRQVGTYLYGRRMYETMTPWETDPALAAASPVTRDFAELWQAADKVVYSTTLELAPTSRTRIERRFDPDAVRHLKETAQRRHPGGRGDRGRFPEPEVIAVGPRPPSPRERKNDPYRLAIGTVNPSHSVLDYNGGGLGDMAASQPPRTDDEGGARMAQQIGDGSTTPGGEQEGLRLGAGAIGSLAGVAALVIFMIQNTDDVTVQFLVWDFTWPVWLLVLVAALIGAVVWFGVGVLRRHRRRVERRDSRRD